MVNLIENGAVGGFADFDNRFLDPSLGLHRIGDTTTCIDIGCFYVASHGTPNAELDEFGRCSRDFVALSLFENPKVRLRAQSCRTGLRAAERRPGWPMTIPCLRSAA